MSAARRASCDRSIGSAADGSELGALETGEVDEGRDTLGTEPDMLGTEMVTPGAETCTLGAEPDMPGTETCTSGTVPDAETGTAGVETWGATALLWPRRAAGGDDERNEDGAGELGDEAGFPGDAAEPDETAAAPVGGCAAAAAGGGVAEAACVATAAAPDAVEALGAAAATVGAGTAGRATPPALAAVFTAR
jgi:hypothetical protein